MEKVKFRLKGHESFILREGWLNKGLSVVATNPRVFQENSGADALGVGTNMAKSIRYWLRTAKLMKENSTHGATLTPLGQMIFENDPYLEDEFSFWLIHVNIARNFEQATSWNLFFNTLESSTFTRENLYEMMKTSFEVKTGESLPSVRSLTDDCSAILAMYTENRFDYSDPEDKRNSPFASLGLLHQAGDTYEKMHPSMRDLHYGIIYYMIQNVLKKEKSLRIDDIVEQDDMPGKLLNLSRVLVNEYLDILQAKRYVTVNRAAGLDMIYPNSQDTADDIVDKYYGKRLN